MSEAIIEESLCPESTSAGSTECVKPGVCYSTPVNSEKLRRGPPEEPCVGMPQARVRMFVRVFSLAFLVLSVVSISLLIPAGSSNFHSGVRHVGSNTTVVFHSVVLSTPIFVCDHAIRFFLFQYQADLFQFLFTPGEVYRCIFPRWLDHGWIVVHWVCSRGRFPEDSDLVIPIISAYLALVFFHYTSLLAFHFLSAVWLYVSIPFFLACAPYLRRRMLSVVEQRKRLLRERITELTKTNPQLGARIQEIFSAYGASLDGLRPQTQEDDVCRFNTYMQQLYPELSAEELHAASLHRQFTASSKLWTEIFEEECLPIQGTNMTVRLHRCVIHAYDKDVDAFLEAEWSSWCKTKRQAKAEACRNALTYMLTLQHLQEVYQSARDHLDQHYNIVPQGSYIDSGIYSMVLENDPAIKLVEDLIIFCMQLGLASYNSESTRRAAQWMAVVSLIKFRASDLHIRSNQSKMKSFSDSASVMATNFMTGIRAKYDEMFPVDRAYKAPIFSSSEVCDYKAYWSNTALGCGPPVKHEIDGERFAKWLESTRKLEVQVDLPSEAEPDELQKCLEGTDLEPHGLPEVINGLRTTAGYIEELFKGPMGLNMFKLVALSSGILLYCRSGTFDWDSWSKVERDFSKNSLIVTADVGSSLFRLLSYLGDKGYSVYTDGMRGLLSNPTRFEKWFERVNWIRRVFKNYSNLAAQGTNYSEFHRHLSESMKQGKRYVELCTNLKLADGALVKERLGNLEDIVSALKASSDVSTPRKAPFPILLYGTSGVGKTSIEMMLIDYYAKISEPALPIGKEYQYQVNASSEFWDGFQTHMWATIIEDAARADVQFAPGGDKSISTILDVLSPYPFCPVMARAEEKGFTPYRGEFVVVTTNTKHLNAHAYFSYPGAIHRRFPFVVIPKVKPQYATNAMMDKTKVNADPNAMIAGRYQDLWLYTVEMPTVTHRVGQKTTTAWSLVVHKGVALSDVSQDVFLEWFAEAAAEHNLGEQRRMGHADKMGDVSVCKKCKKQLHLCKCPPVLCAKCNGAPCVCAAPCFACRTNPCTCAIGVGSRACCTPIPSVWDNVVSRVLSVRAWAISCVPTEFFPRKFGDSFVLKVPDFDDDDMSESSEARPGSSVKSVQSAQLTPKSDDVDSADEIQPVVVVPGSKPQGSDEQMCILAGFTGVCLTLWIIACRVTRLAERKIDWIFATEVPAFVNLTGLQENGETRGILRMVAASMAGINGTLRVLRDTWSGTLVRLGLQRPEVAVVRNWRCIGLQALTKPLIVVSLCALLATPFVYWTLWGGCKLQLQGADPVPHVSERVNVWQSKLPREKVDVSDCTRTFKGENAAAFKNRLARQTFVAEIKYDGCCRTVRGIGLYGQTILFNNHAIVPRGKFTLKVRAGQVGFPLGNNVTVEISPSHVFRDPTRDVCMIRVDCMASYADIRPRFVGKDHHERAAAYVLKREDDGQIREIIYPVVTRGNQSEASINDARPVNVWMGFPTGGAQLGDCGSPMVLLSSAGPAVCGIHSLGSDTVGSVVTLDYDYLIQQSKALDSQIAEVAVLEGAKLVPHAAVDMVLSDGPFCLGAVGIERNLVELHEKSPPQFIEDEGHLRIFGSIEGAVRNTYTSQVEQSRMSEFWRRKGITCSKRAPNLGHGRDGWKPKNIALKDMVSAKNVVDQDILLQLSAVFAAECIHACDPEHLFETRPCSEYVAVNGAPGVAYVEHINYNTSAGYPFGKCKTEFLTPCEPQMGHTAATYRPNDEMRARIAGIRESYLQGRRANVIFSAKLKDEPVSQAKFESGKTRLFVAAPMDFTILVRQTLLPFIRLVQNNKFAFESGPGTAAQSAEWGQIHAYLTAFPKELCIAGDYSSFDKKMSAQFMLAAFRVVYIILAEAGYSEEDLLIVKGIATDTSFSNADFFGDLLGFLGTNPSGHPLTVIINGIVNSLYIRYAYYLLNPDHEVLSFRNNVHLFTYGDDNIMGVHPRVASWFYHEAIQGALATIGVKYTMADKESDSVPHLPITQCSFLKRSWVFSTELKNYMCPLEWTSIEKMLCVWVRSKTETWQAQTISTLLSAHYECFWHGREKFESMDCAIKECVAELELSGWMDQAFPTWDEYVQRWLDISARNA
jgi:hypothetical protein